MEIHQHTHPAAVEHRNKWTHYFWEFLMLFLAVFCGFLAENQREHMIEHQRAKVYAYNLYNELKKDTANLNAIIEEKNMVSGKLDTFSLYAREKGSRHITNGMLYYYGHYATWISFFESENTTVEQLKGSGNLRIMGNEVAQKISEYGKKLEELENEYNLTRAEFEKMETLYFKIFDVYINEQLRPIWRGQDTLKRDSAFLLDIPLINDDAKLIKEFTGWTKFESRIYKNHNVDFHQPLKKFAMELLALLKREYHLE